MQSDHVAADPQQTEPLTVVRREPRDRAPRSPLQGVPQHQDDQRCKGRPRSRLVLEGLAEVGTPTGRGTVAVGTPQKIRGWDR
ncbi:hypothetical protein ACWEQN_38895 [Streptomyces sp. NPDC004129]|uniref:hypothetical protein n=1 Tax=Streptomyces sp. NPDC004533 TaxID=3154278 RepID=UPI00339F8C78